MCAMIARNGVNGKRDIRRFATYITARWQAFVQLITGWGGSIYVCSLCLYDCAGWWGIGLRASGQRREMLWHFAAVLYVLRAHEQSG
ncbi:MAG: hypothetical protein GX358_11995 [candidate division WS1 bacterium]|nr:hypothetical protein [candidate division WS1 bacterium]